MIGWNNFIVFAMLSTVLWATGAITAFVNGKNLRNISIAATTTGIAVFACFIAGLWVILQRPPLRTMGETRLWYSLFMAVSGLIVYLRYGYRWILSFSALLATVFIIINLCKPEIHDQTLMPALQSVWFVPHVTVYMFSYSIFGCAFMFAIKGLISKSCKYLTAADNLVYIGFAFLSLGMISGCIWAKQAWGSYWSWDPKETWAAATWAVYAIYIHKRRKANDLHDGLLPADRQCYIWLIIGFILLQMCWYGVNLLPSASQSLHSYIN